VRCIRQQFSTEVNIKACLYSIVAFERFDEEMAVDGEPDHCEYRATGYLMLGDENNWETLKRQYPLQRSLGVDVEIVTPEDLLKLYPQMNVEDVIGGSLGRRAGYLGPQRRCYRSCFYQFGDRLHS
jgi:sarcosine oxidase subunit beta